MSRWLGMGFALLTIAGVGVFFLSRQPKPMNQQSCAHLSQKPTIVAFGDSLVTGYGTTDNSDFVSILSTKLGVPVQNLGRNGDTTATARERVAEVVRQQPDIVILLLGGNDALQRVPVAQTRENLDAILTTLRQVSSVRIHIVLVGVMGNVISDPYRTVFEDLAKRHGVEYVPNILAGIYGHESLMSDQIHPNNEGHRMMAERILPAIEKLCRTMN